MIILLDTDIMIDVLRGYAPALKWLDSLAGEEIVLPGFVVMELIQGCRNRNEQEKLEGFLIGFEVAWPSPEICDAALLVFARFRLSHGIGILDSLIGQLSVSLNGCLYTFNQKHYSGIPGIITNQPYVKDY